MERVKAIRPLKTSRGEKGVFHQKCVRRNELFFSRPPSHVKLGTASQVTTGPVQLTIMGLFNVDSWHRSRDKPRPEHFPNTPYLHPIPPRTPSIESQPPIASRERASVLLGRQLLPQLPSRQNLRDAPYIPPQSSSYIPSMTENKHYPLLPNPLDVTSPAPSGYDSSTSANTLPYRRRRDYDAMPDLGEERDTIRDIRERGVLGSLGGYNSSSVSLGSRPKADKMLGLDHAKLASFYLVSGLPRVSSLFLSSDLVEQGRMVEAGVWPTTKLLADFSPTMTRLDHTGDLIF